MRYPKALKEHGRIGFIAPSFGCDTEPYATRFKATLDRFKQMGYEAILGPNVYEGKGIGKSNTPEACGAEIMDFFMNDKSDIILSVGGGETMCEDLEFVDFAALAKAEPKWFMGYSDNTNLSFPLATLADTASIYGPCASTFGMDIWHKSLEDAFEILSKDKDSYTVKNFEGFELEDETTKLADQVNPNRPCIINQKYDQKVCNGTEFSGRLLGGCLDCLVTHCGTKYDGVKAFKERYKEDGVIWFIEACEYDPIGVRRALWQLDAAGWFEGAKGFIFGRPMRYGEEAFGLNHEDAVTGILAKYGVPIVMGADIGHVPPSMPIIQGSYADVKAGENKLEIKMMLK